MDTDLLKTFLEVHKTRHFGKAAENLFLTQSAVSARIRQLENELGVKLFTRNKNNIQSTAAGQKLLIHAESILTTWNRVRLDVAIEDETRMLMVIGGVPSLWDIYINRWLRNLIKSNPDIALLCEALTADTIYRRIIDGTIDIAFTYEPPQSPNLISDKKISIKYVMVSSKPGISIDEAIKSNYIYVDWGTAFATTHATLFPDMPVPMIRISLGRVARDLIKKCGGSAYLPESMIKRDLELKRLFPVKDAAEIKREAYIVHKENNNRVDQVLESFKI